MSLHRLKETLLPCSSSSAFFQSQPGSPPLPPLPPRRPPKTSLSQQLLRLEASSSSSFPAPPPSPPKPPSQLTAEDAAVKPSSSPPPSQEDEGPRLRRCPPPPPAAALESRGPYEPLVLSPPGERPIVQVPPSINCRLLAHQRDGVKFLYNLYRNNHGGMLGDDIMWLMDRHLYLPSRMADNCQQHICGTFPAMLSLIPLHFRYDWHIYVAVSIPKVEAAKRRLDAISLFLLY